jgi:hypothetical protein
VLLNTFADQTMIAIENARLFDELHDRTDDLSESLQQQTATSEVLQVNSSLPGDLEPVISILLEKVARIARPIAARCFPASATAIDTKGNGVLGELALRAVKSRACAGSDEQTRWPVRHDLVGEFALF